MTLTTDELRRFAAGLADAPERWSAHVSHDGERSYGLIWDDDEVNAWVICWSEDSDTGFHDHDASAAGITVVSGAVREDRMTLGGPHSGAIAREFVAGETFVVEASAIHRVLHAGDGPAVTIHAYSPPLRRTGAYRIGSDGALQRESQPFEVELRAEPALA